MGAAAVTPRTSAMIDIVAPETPVRRHRLGRGVDPVLATAVAALAILGLLTTYTASYAVGYAFFDDGTYFLKRQVAWLVVGTAVAAVTAAVDYRRWRRLGVPMMVATLAMLVAILAFGADRYGSQRWAVTGGSVQPSEIAKLTMVLFIADWLSLKREQVRDFGLGLVPFATITGVVCGLIVLQPDFSTAVLVGAVASAMFFVAGADLRHMLKAGAVAAMALVVIMLRAPYRLERWRTFLDPEADPTGGGFQILQALHAIMRGGLFGVGLGNGQNKHLIPAPHTDAVFAVLGEELGLVGCLVVVALFAVVAWRGFRIAAGAPDMFGLLLAVGITSWIVLQALVNIAVVTALMPFTGIPLPWISFGGSSLVACMAGVGILLNISRRVGSESTGVYSRVDLRRGNSRARVTRSYRARRLARGAR